MKQWKPSLSFQRFRRKHYELNRLYWTQNISHHALLSTIDNLNDVDVVIEKIMPDVPSKLHRHTVGETKQWSTEYLNRLRLHLLVVCSANLENYLHDITFWHLATAGYYDEKTNCLTAVGKALGQPILGRASLPEPLKYAQHLFGISLGGDLTEWNIAYKYRCAAAHNGGIVNARTLKELPTLKNSLHQMIGLEWVQLKKHLGSAEKIAKIIDNKVSNKDLRLLEIRRELLDLKQINQLPPKSQLWEFIHRNYTYKGMKSKEKADMILEFYP
jgi:hypothetical protein